MFSKSLTYWTLAVAVTVSVVVASNCHADSPSGKSFDGTVVLHRAGQLFPFQWDISFKKAIPFGPNLSFGYFEGNFSGSYQTGYYFHDSITDQTTAVFFNQWNSRFRGRYFPVSIYGTSVFDMTLFIDSDGNQLYRELLLEK